MTLEEELGKYLIENKLRNDLRSDRILNRIKI